MLGGAAIALRAGPKTPPALLRAVNDLDLAVAEGEGRRAGEVLLSSGLLALSERLQLAVVIVQNPDRRGEAQLDRAMCDGQGVLGVGNAAAEDRIDVHLKFGMLSQQLKLLVQNFQALLRNVVGLYVVDADLQVFEAGAVQAFDAVGHQQIAIGDHPGHDSVFSNPRDDGV